MLIIMTKTAPTVRFACSSVFIALGYDNHYEYYYMMSLPWATHWTTPLIRRTPTLSTLALKLLFLAVLELGALLSSNLEEALYKST